MYQRLRSLSAAAVLAAAIAGCGEVSPATPNAHASAACSKETTPSRAQVVAVLVEPGASADAGATGAFETVLQGAATAGDHLIIGGISNGASPPNLLVNERLQGEGPNELFQKQDLACKLKAATDVFSRLANEPPLDRANLFAPLRLIHQDLEGTSGPINVLIFSSMRGAGVEPGRLATPTAVARAINKLALAGSVYPCEQWRVYGIVTAASSEPREIRLGTFWQRYFQHCGGSVVAWNTTLPAFPVTNKSVRGPDYALVPVEVIQQAGRMVATLHSDVLFELGSARLVPSANTALDKLLPALRTASGEVHIGGYTDNTGGVALNADLSRRRAETVGKWLTREANIATRRLIIRGLGEADPVATNATERGRAENRRVTISFDR